MANHEPTSRSEALVVGLFSLAVAAVLVLIVFVLIGSGDQSGERRLPPPSDAPSAPASGPSSGASGPPGAQGSVTELQGRAASGRCLPPSVDVLRRQQLAVDVVVAEVQQTSSDGVRLQLVPTRFYRGPETDTVTMEAPGGDLAELLGAGDYDVGDRYLVSATDGRIAVCGLSGPWSPRLDRLYETAFG